MSVEIPIVPGPGAFGGPPVPVVITVTPEMATQWLAGRKLNRRIDDLYVDGLVREMRQGRFHDNNLTLGFEWLDGRWRNNDGQHRLKAIMLSGVTQRMICVFGADPRGVDVGRIRQYGQQLSMNGFRNGSDLAAILRACVLWGLQFPPGVKANYRPTWDDMEDLRVKHPCIESSLQVANALRNSIGLRSSTAGWLIFATAHVSGGCDLPDDGWFIERLINGDSMSTGHPILTLRNRIIGDAAFRKDGFRLAAGCVYAWNAYRQGRDLLIIKIPGNLTPAMFPEVAS